MLTATSRSVPGSLRQEVLVDGRHLLTTDEPERLGGEGSAPAPHELFPAALAACVSTTLVMYARTKGWDLGEVEVDVDYDNRRRRGGSTSASTLGALALAEQLARLEKVAATCPVRRAVETGIVFEETDRGRRGPSGTRPDRCGRRYATRPRPWCSGNTRAFQALVTGSTPVGRFLRRSVRQRCYLVGHENFGTRASGSSDVKPLACAAGSPPGCRPRRRARPLRARNRHPARVGLGLSPWDVLHQGIARHTPLSFGVANVCVSVAVARRRLAARGDASGSPRSRTRSSSARSSRR